MAENIMDHSDSTPRCSSDGGSSTPDLRKRCSATETISGSGEETSLAGSTSQKVPRKFITTWRNACDKTKDRTRDLFKRWRTLPESADSDVGEPCPNTAGHGWSMHVWTTWVKRYPSEEEDMFIHEPNIVDAAKNLTPVQTEKLTHFFTQLFDMDRDDLISIQDFDSFTERLRHFADWSENSVEYLTLHQVQEGFMEEFIPFSQKDLPKSRPEMQVVSLEEWLGQWGKLIQDSCNLRDFPVWLQYLPKLLFQVINTSGSGIISRDELSTFYMSVVGYTLQQVSDLIPEAYRSMTANGQHPLTYSVYRLCFANFLLGRFPNGPGNYIFGYISKRVEFFPIDYSAMNTPPEEQERYTPDKKSNRHSVIV